MRFWAIVAIAITVVIVIASLTFLGIFRPPVLGVDTASHSYESDGFYGAGKFTGELLRDSTIKTNVTQNNASYSQSIVFQGSVCQRFSGQGRAFFDGSKASEPDVQYKLYINGFLTQTYSVDMGDSTATLPNCVSVPQREYVVTGQIAGLVKIEMVVYTFGFTSGSGGYHMLLSDQAVLQ